MASDPPQIEMKSHSSMNKKDQFLKDETDLRTMKVTSKLIESPIHRKTVRMKSSHMNKMKYSMKSPTAQESTLPSKRKVFSQSSKHR